MEYGGGDGGDHHNASSDAHKRKKRYHRHTANPIQRLEAVFKDCPHPDEKQRLQLSRELGLAPRQIKFWFQNRRTQMKAQHEMRGGMEKVEKKHEKRESHARWLKKRKAKGNKKL